MILHDAFAQDRLSAQHSSVKLLFLFSILSLIIGCVSPHPMSNEVRPGGTILVPVSASDGADMIKKSQVVATINDVNNVDHTATVRNLMRVFPDTTSHLGRGVAGDTYNEPHYYQSQWLAVIDLVDSGGTHLPLAVGPSTLTLTENGSQLGMQMDLEILPGGPTTPNPLESPQGPTTLPWLNYTSPSPQMALRLDGVPAGRDVAAASIKLRYQRSAFSNTVLLVSRMTNDPYLQMNARTVEIDAMFSEIHIVLVNSNGFHDISGLPGSYRPLPVGKSLERDLSSIVVFWPFGFIADQAALDAAVSIEEENFYDIDGNLLSDLGVTLEFLGNN